MENKITSKDILNGLVELVANADIDEESKTLYTEFLNKKIAQMEAKMAKDRERAAERKSKPDTLYNIVLGLMTSEPQTLKELLAQIDYTEAEELDATTGKIAARCRKMMNSGLIKKESVKRPEEKGKVVAYKLATNAE